MNKAIIPRFLDYATNPSGKFRILYSYDSESKRRLSGAVGKRTEHGNIQN